MRVRLTYLEHGTTARVEVPGGRARASELVPALHGVADLLVGRVLAELEAAGRPSTCGPGCGACCRRVIPVCEPEIHALAHLVGDLEPAAAERVRIRFEHLCQRLERAGLADALRRPPPLSVAYTQLMRDYAALAEPCPFLVDESCSIYPRRPIICRDFGVTTPPAWCADPFDPRISVVRPDVYLINAVAPVLGSLQGRQLKITPLSLALEWAAGHPEEPLAGPALDVFVAILDELARLTGGAVTVVLRREP